MPAGVVFHHQCHSKETMTSLLHRVRLVLMLIDDKDPLPDDFKAKVNKAIEDKESARMTDGMTWMARTRSPTRFTMAFFQHWANYNTGYIAGLAAGRGVSVEEVLSELKEKKS